MSVKSLILMIILMSCCATFSQTLNGKRTEIEDADEHFNQRNFPMAIPVYKIELKKSSVICQVWVLHSRGMNGRSKVKT